MTTSHLRLVTIGLFVTGWVSSPAARLAQPTATLNVAVRVASFAARGDTITLGYSIQNLASSTLELWTLGLVTPVAVVSMSKPVDNHDWSTLHWHGDERLPMWATDGDNIRPGESSPELRLSAVGLTDLVEYLAVPDLAQVADSVDDDLPHDQMREHATRGMTVSIVPKPVARTPTIQLSKLSGFVDQSCRPAGWITQQGVCDALRTKLADASAALSVADTAGARGALGAFLNELDAQYGTDPDKAVTVPAYALLRPNIIFLLSLL